MAPTILKLYAPGYLIKADKDASDVVDEWVEYSIFIQATRVWVLDIQTEYHPVFN